MEQQQSVQDNPLAFESTGRLIAKYSVPSMIAMLVSSLYIYKWTPAYRVQLFQFHRKSLERDFLIPHQADTVFASSDIASPHIPRN